VCKSRLLADKYYRGGRGGMDDVVVVVVTGTTLGFGIAAPGSCCTTSHSGTSWLSVEQLALHENTATVPNSTMLTEREVAHDA